MDERAKGSLIGGFKGSNAGLAAGASFGPWGAVAGAVAGGVIGNVTGWMSADEKMKAERRKAAAWAKAQKMLEESRLRSDAQRRELLGQSFAPLNEMMMQQGGASANMMGDYSMFQPQDPVPVPKPKPPPPLRGERNSGTPQSRGNPGSQTPPLRGNPGSQTPPLRGQPPPPPDTVWPMRVGEKGRP